FHRVGCVSGVFVYRSTNGGQTWSRPIAGNPNAGDTRTPGDGVVAVQTQDQDCQIFYDKEMIATGPRPAGVAPLAGSDTNHLSSDRLYITFSEFGQAPPIAVPPYINPILALDNGAIFAAYSDDQGRTWSTPQFIAGSDASLCGAGTGV